MKRILTTHVGSLPRPQTLLPFVRGDLPKPENYRDILVDSTKEVIGKQNAVGLDVINDGELSRRDYVTAARERLSGFGGFAIAASPSDLDVSEEYSKKFSGRKGLLTLEKETEVKNAACSSEIEYTSEGLLQLQDEISILKQSADISNGNVFFSSPSPGTLTTFFDDAYYGSHEKYIEKLGAAMKTEYEEIYASGLIVQVDCPDLAMGRHTKFKDMTISQFQDICALHVNTMNAALENIPADKIRIHVCWGNYPGPHHHDVPLKDILPQILKAKAKYISVEACNPGHAHEWKVLQTLPKSLLQDKVFIPGCLDTTTAHVEHPELVAQRIEQYASVVGPEGVMAGTDCGFSTAAGATNISEDIVWLKMGSLVKGAEIASKMMYN